MDQEGLLMKVLFTVAYIAHMLAIAGILGILLSQIKKSPRKLSAGILHSAATALIAGIVMVGAYSSAKPDEELNHTKVGIKLIIVLAILVLGYLNVKKPELKKNIWLTLIGLTVGNILIAVLWH
jgi:uncharacterized membrane protein YadS